MNSWIKSSFKLKLRRNFNSSLNLSLFDSAQALTSFPEISRNFQKCVGYYINNYNFFSQKMFPQNPNLCLFSVALCLGQVYCFTL